MSTSTDDIHNINIPSSNNIDAISDNLDKVTVSDDLKTNITLSTCANCGKKGSDSDMNTCNRCNMVKYCNAACKKKHRSKHKKKCDRRVAELHDIELFKHPPQLEYCPICFLLMPAMWTEARMYMPCCGKVMCSGCVHANKKLGDLCPFCRTPSHITTDEETTRRITNRVEMNDHEAMYHVGNAYAQQLPYGLLRSMAKALKLWHQAAELGHYGAYYNMGNAYNNGIGVGVDKKKATHYFELAAMGGHVVARHNLGAFEGQAGNHRRAKKHYMIAVECGYTESLTMIKTLFIHGLATKDDYTKSLQAHQSFLDEVTSNQRDEAAAFNADWTYY